ncbi:hypothetical protein [Haliangium ochraceum]|nr:hypothetical protein [Haliangium ochraceum]
MRYALGAAADLEQPTSGQVTRSHGLHQQGSGLPISQGVVPAS